MSIVSTYKWFRLGERNEFMIRKFFEGITVNNLQRILTIDYDKIIGAEIRLKTEQNDVNKTQKLMVLLSSIFRPSHAISTQKYSSFCLKEYSVMM